ncbi:uncharacterized protein LOC122963007 [Acropora millepora]|uniref:uncharacterized protein LOC122963007 n=1 Tax=Acropora millepora TaxID=45264 RepID=UPI001CF1EBDC|nr:uncharacterized protein LOC122963007 [Acropora millepora]
MKPAMLALRATSQGEEYLKLNGEFPGSLPATKTHEGGLSDTEDELDAKISEVPESTGCLCTKTRLQKALRTKIQLNKKWNVEQLRNLKKKINRQQRLTWDEIYNVHEMALDMENFVHHITTFPDMVIVCGLKQVLEEMELVLGDGGIDQLLSYDTTFTMGDFYVSILIFRHTFFLKNPCIPALFLIHERKYEECHRKLFHILDKLVKFPRGEKIACVTDGERGIVNSVQSLPQLVDVRCWNHVFNDVKGFVTKNGGRKEEAKVYKDDIKTILKTKDEQDSTTTFLRVSRKWSELFTDYYLKHIKPLLPKLALWALSETVLMDEETGITQNQSESINFVMHSLLKWKEVPIDVLLLAIYRLQLYFLKEIKRGKAGIGSYALRAEQRPYAITVQEIPDLTVCPPENIIESIKNKTFPAEPTDGKMDIPLSRAEEIIKSGKVVFSPQLGTFTVMAFSDVPRVVRLYPTEYSSCGVKTTCYHKIAVKKKHWVGNRNEA